MTHSFRPLLVWLAGSNRFGSHLMRIAIAIVFLWIGALKFVPYEADSITPFVANSPVMFFFYEHPKEYKAHLTHEGELKPSERAWQTANNTYTFSHGLGTVELTIGLLTLAGLISRRLGFVGAVLSFLTPIVTLSFLFTTPEAWVAALGDAQHGFPYLSGAGRLVLKDVMMLAGALLVMADSARALLKAQPSIGEEDSDHRRGGSVDKAAVRMIRSKVASGSTSAWRVAREQSSVARR
jgi:uncharacterized membrane protein YkgB